MNKQKDRLVELLGNANKEVWNLIHISCCEERLKLLEEIDKLRADYLLASGVIVPPCKVGQTVYTRYGYSFKIQRIEVLEDKKILFRCGNDGTEDYMAFYDFEIGTDVFLTKEEAEQALNNIQNGNSCEGGVE